MDSFVREKLHQWNLGDLVERFNEEAVDEESFMLLDDPSIAALIPKIGPRVKFKKFHSELLASVGLNPVNNQSCVNHSSKRNEPPTPTQTVEENCQTTRSNYTFDVREILKTCGGATLVTALDRDRFLSLKERRRMVRLLVTYLMETFGETPTSETKKEMALAVTTQFPCLKSSVGNGYEAWYTPATGYLEERLRNVRKRLRAQHSQRQLSFPPLSQSSSMLRGFSMSGQSLGLIKMDIPISVVTNFLFITFCVINTTGVVAFRHHAGFPAYCGCGKKKSGSRILICHFSRFTEFTHC